MKLNYCKTLLFLLLISLGFGAFGAETLPEEAQELQTKADRLQSYQTRFRLQAKESDGEVSWLEGELLFQRPNKRRLSLRLVGEEEPSQMIVSDGEIEWQYYPLAQVVYRSKSLEVIPGPHRPFAELQDGSVRFLEWVGRGSQERLRFEGTPLESVTAGAPELIQAMRLEIGRADGLTRKLSLIAQNGEEMLTQEYYDIELNPEIGPTAFTFTPPQEAEIVEIDETLNGDQAP